MRKSEETDVITSWVLTWGGSSTFWSITVMTLPVNEETTGNPITCNACEEEEAFWKQFKIVLTL
jgi:hypothetical protein